MTDKIVVLSTCGSEEEAKKVARELVEQRLAACVQIVPGLTSIYRWQGEITEDAEWLLVIKSRRDLMERLRTRLAFVHSYEVPEVVALTVVDSSPAYMRWLDRELAGTE